MGTQELTTRRRQLTPGQQRRLQALRYVTRLLDSAIMIPGTSYRIGLDPIIGIVPVIGDLASPLFAIAVLWQARDLGIPRVVQLRMAFNAGLDVLAGAVPLVGDVFDFAWKANDKNLALLEQYAYEEHRPSMSDWAFVIAMIVVVITIAAIPVLVAGLVISAAWTLMSSWS
jgi:hypothetical protein